MRIRLPAAAIVILWAMLALSQHAYSQGIVVPGVGPINRSMGGAATAAPLDAAGAIHWNPATMSGLPNSEVVVGLEMLYLSTHVETDIGGSTRSDSGVSALPTLALAWQPDDSPWTFGLGLFTIGGFGVNYPLDPTNPVLAGGPVYSRLQVLQLVPSASLKLTDRLSVGVAPTITMADAALDVPSAIPVPLTHSPLHWGVGFQLGVYYQTDSCWNFGASYKSPQWFEDFDHNTPIGTVPLNVEYPAIYSVGVSYTGLPRLVWALDLRYVDYEDANLFGNQPAPGALGLGWESVFSVSTGAQFQLNQAWSFRVGYIFNENPIPDEFSAVNIPSAAIYQHIVACGLTWRMTCRTSFSVAYLRAFESSITGPLAPGVTVTNRQTIDALVAGLEVKF